MYALVVAVPAMASTCTMDRSPGPTRPSAGHTSPAETDVAPFVGRWIGGLERAALGSDANAPYLSMQLLPFPAGLTARIELPALHRVFVTDGVDVANGRVRIRAHDGSTPVLLDGSIAESGELRGRAIVGARQGTLRMVRPSTDVAFDRIAGAYRLALGEELIVTAQGWVVEPSTGSIRALTPLSETSSVAGPAFGIPFPFTARFDAVLGPDGGARAIVRTVEGEPPERAEVVPATRTQVRFPSGGVRLAGTLARPAGGGRRPAIVFVHGGGPSTRDEFSLLSSFLVAHGFVTFAYDKRGIGGSGGTYPGDLVTPETIHVLARDARAAISFLRRQAGVDARRVALVGDSQAGWIIPIVADAGGIAMAVMVVGPTLDSGRVDTFASRTSGGETAPAEPRRTLLGEVRRQHASGFDPRPYLERMDVPAFWALGARDWTVPTELCLAELRRLRASGHPFGWKVFPHAGHDLLDTGTGLRSDEPTATRFAPGLFATYLDWLGRGMPGS